MWVRCRLFIDLEDAGVGDAAGGVFQLEGIEAAGELAKIDRCFIGDIRHILYLFAEEAEYLQGIGLIRFFCEFECDVRNGRVRVEFYHFMIRLGQRPPYLAFSLGGSQ